MDVFGVIMAGGGGTRFWPLSRQAFPKQLLNLSGKDLMISETIDRLHPLIAKEHIYIVTSEQQKGKMIEATTGRITQDHILSEPEARNTSACIGLAAIEIAKRYEDGIMCIFPADHYISDEKAFRKTISAAVDIAMSKDQLVTIGIKPTYAATGFGYIKYNKSESGISKRVLAFKEKPNTETAQEYCLSGDYAWNSGMFIWKASVILEQYKKLLPDIYEELMRLYNAIGTNNERKVKHEIYPRIRKISIDYGVLEKSDKLVVIPADFGWNDVGSWDMMHIIHNVNENGNVLVGDVNSINTTNSVIYSTSKHISVIDMDDIVVVETSDAIMICKQSKAQNVKNAVDKLAAENRTELL